MGIRQWNEDQKFRNIGRALKLRPRDAEDLIRQGAEVKIDPGARRLLHSSQVYVTFTVDGVQVHSARVKAKYEPKVRAWAAEFDRRAHAAV